MKGLLPTITYIPADYDTAEKKVLERPSVRADVADFITEYLYSDVSQPSDIFIAVLIYSTEHRNHRVNLARFGGPK